MKAPILVFSNQKRQQCATEHASAAGTPPRRTLRSSLSANSVLVQKLSRVVALRPAAAIVIENLMDDLLAECEPERGA
jgi:hypothetical protein